MTDRGDGHISLQQAEAVKYGRRYGRAMEMVEQNDNKVEVSSNDGLIDTLHAKGVAQS